MLLKSPGIRFRAQRNNWRIGSSGGESLLRQASKSPVHRGCQAQNIKSNSREMNSKSGLGMKRLTYRFADAIVSDVVLPFSFSSRLILVVAAESPMTTAKIGSATLEMI